MEAWGQSVAEKPRAAERKETGCSNGENRSPDEKQVAERCGLGLQTPPGVWNPISALARPQEIKDGRHRGRVWPSAQLLPSPGPALRQGTKATLTDQGSATAARLLAPEPKDWLESRPARKAQ